MTLHVGESQRLRGEGVWVWERPHRRAHARTHLICREVGRACSSAIVSRSISSTCARRQRRLDIKRLLASRQKLNDGEAGAQSRCSRFVSRVRCGGIAIGRLLLPRSRFARVAAPTTTDTTPTRPTRAMVVCSLFRGEGRRVPNGSSSAQRTSASARRPPGRTFGGSPFAPATRRRLRMTYWRRQKFPTDFPVSHD